MRRAAESAAVSDAASVQAVDLSSPNSLFAPSAAEARTIRARAAQQGRAFLLQASAAADDNGITGAPDLVLALTRGHGEDYEHRNEASSSAPEPGSAESATVEGKALAYEHTHGKTALEMMRNHSVLANLMLHNR
jgi:hypothetical protein